MLRFTNQASSNENNNRLNPNVIITTEVLGSLGSLLQYYSTTSCVATSRSSSRGGYSSSTSSTPLVVVE